MHWLKTKNITFTSKQLMIHIQGLERKTLKKLEKLNFFPFSADEKLASEGRK
jgi:hypothetical protein